MASLVSATWPFWAATRQSSMTWATRTPSSMPTIRAAPLMECAVHQRLDDTELAWFFFQREQALVQGLGMALDLDPEQLEHGVVAEVLGVAQGHVGTMVRRRRVGS